MNSELDDLPPPPPPPRDTRGAMTPHVDAAATGDAAFGAAQGVCPNCGAPVHGPYCYACGQSEKGMVRHASEVLRDLADIVFNVDSRVFRSIFDLYFRPGFLTTEYIAGRRARYVTPFRLFFILSIIAFFAMQSMIDRESVDKIALFTVDEGISTAQTAAEVDERVAAAVTELRETVPEDALPAAAGNAIDAAEAGIRTEGEQRRRVLDIRAATTAEEVAERVERHVAAVWSGADSTALEDSARSALTEEEDDLREEGKRRLRRLEKAGADGDTPTDAGPDRSGISIDRDGYFTFNGQRWDPAAMPVNVSWLPAALNARLTATAVHMGENFRAYRDNTSLALTRFLSMLPQTLFLLMPLFALMLKVYYVFKRRLYMEHLLVALHSHAFIFLTLIVSVLLSALQAWAVNVPWVAQPLDLLYNLAWIWLLVYLFWMQKRIYRHGWIMAFVMYGVISTSYLFLLVFGVLFAGVLTLALG